MVELRDVLADDVAGLCARQDATVTFTLPRARAARYADLLKDTAGSLLTPDHRDPVEEQAHALICLRAELLAALLP